jgi:SAM-dependent methyltransferase
MSGDKLQPYYMNCKRYFLELRTKGFDYWFSAYFSALKTRDGWILDVGCGVGQVVSKLSENGFTALGVDISPIGIRMATKQDSGLFIVASAAYLPFRDCSFASVGFHDFLEHTSYPEACLSEMVRVLRNGGKIVAMAPNFLRVIGLSQEYHWHMRGPRRKISNLLSLIRKTVISKVSPRAMRFDFMHPQLDIEGAGGDTDAVCVTNPIDIKFSLRRLNVEITMQSAAPGYPEGVVEKLGKLPIVRSISSSTFLLGKKGNSY